MTTNSPNPVDGDVQALIADCEAEIKHIEHLLSWKKPNEYSDKSLRSKLARQRIALASLTAEPVADVVKWNHPQEERTCSVQLRRFDISAGHLYTTPPAQLLRPVELPETYDDGHGNLWLPQDAVISAVKNAGGEVKK